MWAGPDAWNTLGMGSEAFDIGHVTSVLRKATETGGAFSMRGLSKEAGLHRDTVSDIIAGRNRNPTLRVLSSLAEAMGVDLTAFGIDQPERADAPTEVELAQALREALPNMPKGSLDRRVQFLAEAVAQSLRLPPDRPTGGHDDALPEEDVLPPAPTN